MLSLYAQWSEDGRIAKNDFTANQQLLVLGIILAVVWLLLSAMFAYYLWQFRKTETKARIFGWPLIIGATGLSAVMLVCWILNMVFYLNAEKIFTTPNIALNTVIALFAIGYAALIVLMVGIWFFISRFAVGLDDEKILFIGEKIAYSRITKVIKDEKKHALYINYTQGRRNHKRQKFNLNSVTGQFMLKNIALTGHKAEIGDENEYFKNIISNAAKTSQQNEQETK